MRLHAAFAIVIGAADDIMPLRHARAGSEAAPNILAALDIEYARTSTATARRPSWRRRTDKESLCCLNLPYTIVETDQIELIAIAATASFPCIFAAASAAYQSACRRLPTIEDHRALTPRAPFRLGDCGIRARGDGLAMVETIGA